MRFCLGRTSTDLRASVPAMKRFRLTCIVVAVVLSLVATACRPKEASDTAQGAVGTVREGGGASMSVALDGPSVYLVGPVEIDLILEDDGSPVAGASVRVTGDMTHAGMVPVEAGATEVGPGRYRTDGFGFTMAGDWILTIDVTRTDGTTSMHEAAVRVQRP